MFLGMPLVHFLVDNKDYLTELFSIRNMLSGIFEAIFFGAIMQGLVNAVSNKPNLKLKKMTNKLKRQRKNPGFPAWIFARKKTLRLVYAKPKCVQKIVS